MRSLPAFSLCVVLATALGSGATRAAVCAGSHGERVVLASEAVDPDVFVWDSRDRLLTYAAGQWRDTRAIFAHTMLAEPGTQATLMSCTSGGAGPAAAQGSFGTVGVRVVSGRYRGRYGWVLASDVHFASRPRARFAVSRRNADGPHLSQRLRRNGAL